MNFGILASLIVFCVWLAYEIRKSKKIESRHKKSFWDLENEANNTRRKPLDDLVYITIPFDILPFNLLTDDAEIAECHQTLRSLSEHPVVNFTGISNTDLKLRYGAPNIDLLSQYDQRYTLLARTLQKWAERLASDGYIAEPITILEFAVSTGTDVSRSYFLLADLYQRLGRREDIERLIPAAELLNSTLRNHIVERLKSLSHYEDQ
ncbi:MAG: hypothetical protein LBV33_08210 [Lachnospiraceae bacterium]|jgi:hypothetical protein|nr:hypothetical protein [Lachnospiraceae bacterium]